MATRSRPVWTPILPPGSAKALAVSSSKTVTSHSRGAPAPRASAVTARATQLTVRIAVWFCDRGISCFICS